MLFRSAISEIKGLQYLAEELDLKSPMGKRFLLDSVMLTDETALDTEFDLIEKAVYFLNTDGKVVSDIQHKLSQLRDIRGTIANLKANLILDDVELFEIKSFAIYAQEILNLFVKVNMNLVELPNLNLLIENLDPQGTGIPSFYIYDDYSTELANARKEFRIAKSGNERSDSRLSELQNKAEEIESLVREELCSKIFVFAAELDLALQNLAHLDLIIAKANQSIQMKFTKPALSNGSTEYKGMYNPLIKNEIEKQNKKYQAIDIELTNSVCLITGANMAGKTVVLKTLALCQYLCQFGFFIPASSAKIHLVDEIMLSVGDEQSELNGLSSFASEMTNVSKMVDESQEKANVLILIDELARTTNPVEGLAIVNAVADIFYQNKIRSVITTHYSGLNSYFRKLRVKGLDKDFGDSTITKNNINSYMDYSLIEDNTGEVPHEALRIASLLGINKEIVNRAKSQLNEKASKEEN